MLPSSVPVFHPIATPAAVVTCGKARFTVLKSRLIRMEYDPDAPTQFSMAAGTYSGESAIAAGLFHNPNKDVLLSVGFSISGSEKAANVGATFRFGRSSESKARKVIEDKQREQELAAQVAAARQKTVSYRVEQILAEDTAKAE